VAALLTTVVRLGKEHRLKPVPLKTERRQDAGGTKKKRPERSRGAVLNEEIILKMEDCCQANSWAKNGKKITERAQSQHRVGTEHGSGGGCADDEVAGYSTLLGRAS
jgi:hypothetical protein